jgi:hypothetical protein
MEWWRILLGFCSCGWGKEGSGEGEEEAAAGGGGRGGGDECDYESRRPPGLAGSSKQENCCRLALKMLWVFGPFLFSGLEIQEIEW